MNELSIQRSNSSTLQLQKIAAEGIQVGPAPDKETIARRTQYGYDLTVDLPKELNHYIIDSLLTTTDTAYHALLSVKRTCAFFYVMVNELMLEFIKNKHNPKAIFCNQFEILACADSSSTPDCLISNLHKATTLFCLASAHPTIIACQFYVKIFNYHVNNLLAQSERNDFKLTLFQKIKKSNLLHLEHAKLPFNKYLFMRFLEKYISNSKFIDFVNCTSVNDEHKWKCIIKLLAHSQSTDNLFLIYQLIDKLSNPFDNNHAYNRLWILRRMSIEGLIQESTAHYLLTTICSCLKPNQVNRVKKESMLMLMDYVKKDFLTSEHVEKFIEEVMICSKYNGEEDIKVAKTAIEFLAQLSIKKLIAENIIQEYIKEITGRLNVHTYGAIASAILLALATLCTTEFLDFHKLDKLIPTILLFLERENKNDQQNSILLIEALAAHGFNQTQHGNILTECFLKILVNENHSHYEQIFNLSNQLFKAKTVVRTDKLINKLKNIATNNLKNENKTIRAHAVELLSLVASPEEQNKIVHTLVLQSMLESFKGSPNQSGNFTLPDLITFFNNFDSNAKELTEQSIRLIAEQIEHRGQK